VLDPGIRSRVDTWYVTAIENPNRRLRSGELAQAAGVSTDTLRHYERLGILKKPPRTEGGYRSYPAGALDRVNLIRNALASGFTLRELTTILQVRDAGGAPCQQVVGVAREKVQQLDVQIAQLTHLRNSLKSTLREWGQRLKQTPDGGRARLLESLPQAKKASFPPHEKVMRALIFALALILPTFANGQSATTLTGHEQPQGTSDAHASGVDTRGNHAMGFSHETSTHHFRLLLDEFVSQRTMQRRSRRFINFLRFRSTTIEPAIHLLSVLQDEKRSS
jgi:DNA-binding transcriptional MerR regulator